MPLTPGRRFSEVFRTRFSSFLEEGRRSERQKLQDEVFEVTLHLSAKASVDGKAMFLVDLAYAAIFQVANIPENRIEQLIMIDCPFVLFPFARRVIADTTRDGGFPPLMLDPIDFHALYLQNRQRVEGAG